ncbi:MAG: response regulator [Cyclobacteriaceae bacterium]|nr:response regulator [Cyclobacteriaceae bacterium]
MKKSLQTYITRGKFYQTVVDDGSDIVLVVDYDGKILYHNASVKKLGYRAGSLKGKSFFELMPAETVSETRRKFKACTKKARAAAVEFEFLTRTGERRHYEFNTINLKQEEGLPGLVLDCRDITDRKRMSEELIEAQKTKDLFLANVSHEIRTPINGIVGMTTLLSQDTSPAEQHAYLTAIRTAAENLKVIINDILDLASIESGKLQYERIDFSMSHLLQTLADTFAVQAAEKGVALSVELAPEADKNFVGDPVRVNQILTNLVSNAVKFTHQGIIAIRCTLEKKSGHMHHLRFEVEDTGIGIAPEKLSDIFESFTQADASITRKYGGTGLGLTIARQLVNLQHGKISVQSEAGKGSLFTVILPFPLARTSRQSKPQPKTETKLQDLLTFEPLLVLLVEDNEINRLYAGSLLKKWNCKVEMAENGKEAVDKHSRQSYDLILMDVQMPVMDGYEATRLIRSGPAPANQVPILALTANASVKDVDKCLEAGMNDCISKPFTPEQLFRRIQKYRPLKASAKGDEKLVNLKYLHEASHQDAEFVRAMVNAIATSLPDSIRTIQEQTESKNWTKVAEAVHRIKSSLKMIGLEKSRTDASRIEELVYTQKTDGIPVLASQLCASLSRALTELQQLQGKI